MLAHFTLKELFLAITLVAIAIVGLQCHASGSMDRFPIRDLFVVVGSVVMITAVVGGLFHRGLSRALFSLAVVIGVCVLATIMIRWGLPR